jgi:hypothetical protein
MNAMAEHAIAVSDDDGVTTCFSVCSLGDSVVLFLSKAF